MAMNARTLWHIGKGSSNAGRNMKNVMLFITMTEMCIQHPPDSQFNKVHALADPGDTQLVDTL